MKRIAIAMTAALLALPAFAQPMPPDDEDMRGHGDEFRDAYRKGYERGFERGYAKGLADGERRAAPIVAPPPPPPPRSGPIHVTGAAYGTSSHNCDATRFMRSHANGKRSYSVEVSNSICGDPAHGDRKSLDVTYRCGEIEKTASANEHRTIFLDCH